MTLFTKTDSKVATVVIGGGFYGCAIAIHLAKHRRDDNIVLVECEDALMKRASYNNQARVHNGYHYPRSFVTAYRSRSNLPRFVQHWPDAVKTDFTKIYAIASKNSKVTARQFKKFCREIGAALEPADTNVWQLFNKNLIEDIFLVQEYAFDSTKLSAWAAEELKEVGADVRLNTRATRIENDSHRRFRIELASSTGHREHIVCDRVFNCTYSGLNQLFGDFNGISAPLKHEITEMALVKMPKNVETFGITVMDGPFFSILPFPARNLHTLSHVRYTPHAHWIDECGRNPYSQLADYEKTSRFDRMIRDTARYLPAINDATYIESLFEVKTVLMKNESDDGRPIHFEQNPNGFYSILGGKIDNIFDILEILTNERL